MSDKRKQTPTIGQTQAADAQRMLDDLRKAITASKEFRKMADQSVNDRGTFTRTMDKANQHAEGFVHEWGAALQQLLQEAGAK